MGFLKRFIAFLLAAGAIGMWVMAALAVMTGEMGVVVGFGVGGLVMAGVAYALGR